MPREASDATKLATARRHIKIYEQSINSTQRERDAWRKRAEKAEAELAEWKQRFDKLLDRTPQEPRS